MSSMAEEVSHHENPIWDDQSWADFTNLGNEEECKEEEKEKLVMDINKLGDEINGDVEKIHEGVALQPQPTVAGKGKKRAAATGKSVGDDQSDEHELHIWTERERRKKMRNMFANLHALLPHLPPKADKSTIVDEAVTYIKNLQQTLHTLQLQKLERLQFTATNYNNPFINFDHFPFINITPQKTHSREAFLAEQGSSTLNNNTEITLPNNQDNITLHFEFPTIFKTWTSPNVILSVCGRDAHINVCSVKKPGLLTAICYVLEEHKLELLTVQVSSENDQCMYMIHAQAIAAANSDQFPQAFAVEETCKQVAAEIMLWVNS